MTLTNYPSWTISIELLYNMILYGMIKWMNIHWSLFIFEGLALFSWFSDQKDDYMLILYIHPCG